MRFLIHELCKLLWNFCIRKVFNRNESIFCDINFKKIFDLKLGLVKSDRSSQFKLLQDIWFDMYPRNRGNVGSSGFEHVFLSEMKYGSPIGLHNWIYFYQKENRTDVDYKGYMRKLTLGNVIFILFNLSLILRNEYHFRKQKSSNIECPIKV